MIFHLGILGYCSKKRLFASQSRFWGYMTKSEFGIIFYSSKPKPIEKCSFSRSSHPEHT